MDLPFLYNRYLRNRRIFEGYKYQYHPFTVGPYDEPLFKDAILKPGDSFVDIGAHVGGWSIPAARYYSEIHAFEALPAIVKILTRNLKMNRVNNVVIYPLALSDKVGKTDLWVYPEQTIGSFDDDPELAKRERTLLGPVETQLLDRFGLNPSLIKIDTEGHEVQVIKGSRRTIERCKPVMAIETHHAGDVKTIVELLPNYVWKLAARRLQTLMLGTPR